jgi:cytidylate kinase
MKEYITIAIDGPSAAGKSTVAREIAKIMNFTYVDTGSLYRAIGYEALRRGIDPQNASAISKMLESMRLEINYENGEQSVTVDGMDVTAETRLPEVSMAASQVSAHPQVRIFLLEFQRKLANMQNVVMDGRDIGTVVVPDAKIKFFLTATPEARAVRRHNDYILQDQKIDYKVILDEIIKRDHADSTRQLAPLRKADDAIVVDNTFFEFKDTVKCLLGHIKRILGQNS